MRYEVFEIVMEWMLKYNYCLFVKLCHPCCCSEMHFNFRSGINLENLKIKIKWKITLYQGGRKLPNCVRNRSQYSKFYIKVILVRKLSVSSSIGRWEGQDNLTSPYQMVYHKLSDRNPPPGDIAGAPSPH